MIVTLMAPIQKAAPQAGTGAGDPAVSGGTPADDQPSFESVLAHEEHTPAPPTGAGFPASGIPRPAKADEGKIRTDGTAPLIPAPVDTTPPSLAAILAAATPPAAAAPTKIVDVAAGSADGLPAKVGVAAAGNGDPPLPVDLARDALAVLLPGMANGTDRTNPSHSPGNLAGAAPREVTAGPAPASDSADPTLLVATVRQKGPSAAAPTDQSSHGRVRDSAPSRVGGPDLRGVGDRAASQGNAPLRYIETTVTPLTAQDREARPAALLARSPTKTAEAQDSRATARPVADPGTSAGAGAAFTAPLSTRLDAGGPKPSRGRPTADQGMAQITGESATKPIPTNPSPATLGDGIAATISSVAQGVGQRTSRMNDGDHAEPVPPAPTHNQAVAVGPLDTRPFTILPGPAGAGVPQPGSGAMARPSANQPHLPEALQSRPAPGIATRVQPSVVASQTPLLLGVSAQSRPPQVGRQPGPTEPGRVGPSPANTGQDHRGALAPSRGTAESSVQGWANGAGALSTAQHARPVAGPDRTASANQSGAVHEPIVQGILVRQASLQMVGAAASFKVVLHPRSLGEVTVQVTRVQEGLHVTIAPQQLTTQTLLNKHLPDLLDTLRTGQDLPVQAQVVAPHAPAPAPLGTPDAAAAGQSGLNFAANGGGGQPFTGGQGGEQRQAWVGTMNDLLREPARTALPAGRAAGTTAARVAGNPRIDVQA